MERAACGDWLNLLTPDLLALSFFAAKAWKRTSCPPTCLRSMKTPKMRWELSDRRHQSLHGALESADASQTQHANVHLTRFIDRLLRADCVLIVLENGHKTHVWLQRTARSVSVQCMLTEQTCTLGTAHGAGKSHSDVRPSGPSAWPQLSECRTVKPEAVYVL